MAKRTAMSYRFTPEAVIGLKQLSKHLGISQTSVMEMAIRKLVREEDMKQITKELRIHCSISEDHLATIQTAGNDRNRAVGAWCDDNQLDIEDVKYVWGHLSHDAWHKVDQHVSYVDVPVVEYAKW